MTAKDETPAIPASAPPITGSVAAEEKASANPPATPAGTEPIAASASPAPATTALPPETVGKTAQTPPPAAQPATVPSAPDPVAPAPAAAPSPGDAVPAPTATTPATPSETIAAAAQEPSAALHMEPLSSPPDPVCANPAPPSEEVTPPPADPDPSPVETTTVSFDSVEVALQELLPVAEPDSLPSLPEAFLINSPAGSRNAAAPSSQGSNPPQKEASGSPLPVRTMTSFLSNDPSSASGSRKVRVRLTFYTGLDDQWGSRVAWQKVRKAKRGRTAAADPSLFPYGTWIHVPGFGKLRIEDTGSAVKARTASRGTAPVIDVYVGNREDARRLARTTPDYVDITLADQPPEEL